MQWLSDLIKKITDLLPRIIVIAPDELGIRLLPGLRSDIRVQELAPGWWVEWPVFIKIETIRCKTQVKDLRPQSVWTLDRHDLTISGAIRYRVRSARKALLEVWDYDQNIQAVAFGIIQQHVREHNLIDLSTRIIEDEVLKEVRKASEGWGLYIERVYITDIGATYNVRLLDNVPR